MLEAFLPYGPQGSSGRVRVLDWLNHTGVSARVHDYAGLSNNSPRTVIRHPLAVLAGESRTRRRVREPHDRVLIQRDVTPFTSGRLPERLAANSGLSVFDFDDAIMWTPRVGAQRIWSRAESCLRSVKAVDRVIAGNQMLADWASQHASDVRFIPSCVEPSSYSLKDEYTLSGPPRLVWLGSPSTEAYVAAFGEALLDIHAATGARLVLISSGTASLGEVDRMIDRREWTPGIAGTMQECDIAIAPLVDGPIERGKCAYKVLQYAATGLPAVVSPVGANAQAATDLGYPVALDRASWVDTIMDLARSTARERSQIGLGARQAVELRYSYAAWTKEWLAAVGEV